MSYEIVRGNSGASTMIFNPLCAGPGVNGGCFNTGCIDGVCGNKGCVVGICLPDNGCVENALCGGGGPGPGGSSPGNGCDGGGRLGWLCDIDFINGQPTKPGARSN